MQALFLKLIANRSGVTSIEYGLMSAMIAIVTISSLRGLGAHALANEFSYIASQL